MKYKKYRDKNYQILKHLYMNIHQQDMQKSLNKS